MPFMQLRRTAVLAATLVATFAVPAVAQNNAHLQQILSQMDTASKSFHSATADVQKQQYEKLVNDTNTQTGKIYFLRNGSSTQVGAKFNPPNAQTMEYKNGTVRLYTEGTNQLQTYNNLQGYEAYLALGFGGSGADLAKSWDITDQGPEQITDGGKKVQVEKLDLVSKNPKVRDNFTHITLWLDPARDVSLKQVFYTPSGDTQTAIYSNIKLNQSMDLKAFEIKCKGKCGS
jgi:outer membrane lipoprotein-sorting protein